MRRIIDILGYFQVDGRKGLEVDLLILGGEKLISII
jgi:hypothetical protein